MIDAYAEIREEARNEGKSLTRKENAMRMLKAGKLSLEDISAYTGLTLDEVKEIQKNLLS